MDFLKKQPLWINPARIAPIHRWAIGPHRSTHLVDRLRPMARKTMTQHGSVLGCRELLWVKQQKKNPGSGPHRKPTENARTRVLELLLVVFLRFCHQIAKIIR